jgi:2-methylcitrate dehydratase PrpD
MTATRSTKAEAQGAAGRAPFLVEQLAEFAIGEAAFPAAVIREGKRLILDQLGCQIAFSELPWSKAYLDMTRALGAGTGATVVYHGDSLSLDQAAFVNSAFGHGGEYDDTQLGSHTHSSAVVVPPVFAVAESRHLSGARALEAIVVGIEVMVRIGAAAAPHLDERGHHAPPVVGPFGAAAGSSRVLDLDVAQCANAMANSGSHASGTREYTRSGGTVKRVHCAIPAMSGLRSAMMAAFGITGPLSIIEGDRGILNLFAGGEFDLSRITDGLGRDYLITETAYKPVTSPWPSHAPLEAFGWLIDEHGLTPEEIEAIEVGTSRQAMNNIRTIKAPRDIMDAHYSLAYGLAVRLYRGGNMLHHYREEDLNDPRFLDLARRVEIKIDPISDEERVRLKNRSAIVTVVTRDGRRLDKRVQFSRGHPRNPMSDEELIAKFLDGVTPLLGKARSRELADRIWNIEALEDVGTLIAMTRKTA